MPDNELPSSENYKIVFCEDDEGNHIYGIENKETNVIEYKDSILSRTYFALGNFEENHARMVADMNGESLIEIPEEATQRVIQ